VGVGIGFSPPKYLRPGDQMRVAITGLGVLENPVG
jgi:2-keto-4-pentenoate hydratase/2-oxohepta-3-ene-1,7-dioic acid hydratase in catechol pathway